MAQSYFEHLRRKAALVEGLVDRRWHLRVKIKAAFTRKLKIGFGPITTGEDDLAERKWRIDPIIDEINRTSATYSAGYFIHPQDMSRFDLVVIVKKFNRTYVPVISALKAQGVRFIYDIVDNPNSEEKYGSYFEDVPEFSALMDGFISSSPLHQRGIDRFSKPSGLIEHPIIHNLQKSSYEHDREIRVLAHGFYANLKSTVTLEPILRTLADETRKKIVLTYHSEHVGVDTDHVRYVKWTVENSFRLLLESDIAISMKDLHQRHQRSKPSTKVISFMAAGLPVVCTPTPADRLVMNPGVTGFFAFTPDDWKRNLHTLVTSASRRRKIGRAARASVVDVYSVKNITRKYIQLFQGLPSSN